MQSQITYGVCPDTQLSTATLNGVTVRIDGMVMSKIKSTLRPKGEWYAGANSHTGYKVVYSQGKTHYIHKLIADAFLLYGVPLEAGFCLDHIDNDKHNNSVLNLQVLANYENTIKQSRRKYLPGVTLTKSGKYRAYTCGAYLGLHDTEDAAYAAVVHYRETVGAPDYRYILNCIRPGYEAAK